MSSPTPSSRDSPPPSSTPLPLYILPTSLSCKGTLLEFPQEAGWAEEIYGLLPGPHSRKELASAVRSYGYRRDFRNVGRIQESTKSEWVLPWTSERKRKGKKVGRKVVGEIVLLPYITSERFGTGISVQMKSSERFQDTSKITLAKPNFPSRTRYLEPVVTHVPPEALTAATPGEGLRLMTIAYTLKSSSYIYTWRRSSTYKHDFSLWQFPENGSDEQEELLVAEFWGVMGPSGVEGTLDFSGKAPESDGEGDVDEEGKEELVIATLLEVLKKERLLRRLQ